jgi:endo-1,4-beta-xylanase
LYINDYNIESMNNKSMVHAQLARSLLDAGVPIDGVGFQCHFIGGSVPEDLAETMAMFTDMGLEVPLTELDVRVPVNNRGIANSTWLDIQSVYPPPATQTKLTG